MFCSGNSTFLTKDFILTNISEEELLQHYFGVKKVPCIVNSFLRKDNNPSLGIFYNEHGNITFFDHGTKQSGNLFQLLRIRFNLDFNGVLEKIYHDMIKSKKNINYDIKIKRTKKPKQREYIIKVEVRDILPHDIQYWNSYGINDFIKYRIFPIKTIEFIDNVNNKHSVFKAAKYAYAYYERKDDRNSFKIYQPYSERKWFNNHDNSVWDLWPLLPEKGEQLIITSSRKDAANLWENLGIPSTSLQAENCLPKPQVINQLKKRFSKIYVFYDNDYNKEVNYGNNFGKHMAETFGLIQLEIPKEYASKDPSDLYKNQGKEVYLKVMKELLSSN